MKNVVLIDEAQKQEQKKLNELKITNSKILETIKSYKKKL